jgi:putative ABC transport system permease protein
MGKRFDSLALRLCLAIVRAVRPLVPSGTRDAWAREWEAELRSRWSWMQRRSDTSWPTQADLLRRSTGAVADAAWIRQQFTADLDVMQDVRHGLRVLRQRPGVSLLAIAVLALAIGATIAIFSMIDVLLLRELPYRDPHRVVTISERQIQTDADRQGVAPGNFLEWRDRATAFEHIAAADPWSFDYLEGPEPTTLIGALVSQGFFEAFGVELHLGRVFRPEEFQPGRENVVVLSHGSWRQRFGGDRGIVGRPIRLEGKSFLVIGVLPASFQPNLLDRAIEREIWAPKIFQEYERRNRRSAYWNVVARLKPDVTIERAQAELDAISGQLAKEYPRTNTGISGDIDPLREHLTGSVREPLLVLFGAVAVVLLIACANVASLQLARGVE